MPGYFYPDNEQERERYKNEMSEESFHKLYLGVFENLKPTDYPELKKEIHFSGIYSHICPICKSEFYGYKRRVHCFDCNARLET